MPKSSYFNGNGREVWANMVKEYGRKRAEAVFFKTAAKRKQRPKDKAR